MKTTLTLLPEMYADWSNLGWSMMLGRSPTSAVLVPIANPGEVAAKQAAAKQAAGATKPKKAKPSARKARAKPAARKAKARNAASAKKRRIAAKRR